MLGYNKHLTFLFFFFLSSSGILIVINLILSFNEDNITLWIVFFSLSDTFFNQYGVSFLIHHFPIVKQNLCFCLKFLKFFFTVFFISVIFFNFVISDVEVVPCIVDIFCLGRIYISKRFVKPKEGYAMIKIAHLSQTSVYESSAVLIETVKDQESILERLFNPIQGFDEFVGINDVHIKHFFVFSAVFLILLTSY